MHAEPVSGGRRPVEIAVSGARRSGGGAAPAAGRGSTSSSPASRPVRGRARTYVAAEAVRAARAEPGQGHRRPQPQAGAGADRRRELRPPGDACWTESAGERLLEGQPGASSATAKTMRSSPLPAARWRRTPRPRSGPPVEREAAHAGAEGDQRQRAGAELVGHPQRARGRLADDLGRGRPAELHRRGVDHPARRHLAGGRRDRLAEARSAPPRRSRAGSSGRRRARSPRRPRRRAGARCWRRWRSRRPRAS